MKKQLYAGLAAFAIVSALQVTMTDSAMADPLTYAGTFQMTGRVEAINAATGSIVISDREYLLPAAGPGRNRVSAETPRLGTRVKFSYQEGRPLPMITEISAVP